MQEGQKEKISLSSHMDTSEQNDRITVNACGHPNYLKHENQNIDVTHANTWF